MHVVNRARPCYGQRRRLFGQMSSKSSRITNTQNAASLSLVSLCGRCDDVCHDRPSSSQPVILDSPTSSPRLVALAPALVYDPLTSQTQVVGRYCWFWDDDNGTGCLTLWSTMSSRHGDHSSYSHATSLSCEWHSTLELWPWPSLVSDVDAKLCPAELWQHRMPICICDIRCTYTEYTLQYKYFH